MRITQRILAVLLLASCAFLAAYLGFRSSHRAASSSADAARLAATGTGTAATSPPAQPAGTTGSADQTSTAAVPAIPDALPDARVPDLSGNAKSIRDFPGHPLIVNFWATWSEPCRREMPLLQQLQQREGPNGLQILGVAIDSRDAVKQYLQARPVSYPILADENAGSEAMSRFADAPVLPFSVVADAQGRILLVKFGELHADEADYILTTAREVAAGHQTLLQGRSAIASKLRDLAIARAKADHTS
jgi:thiol-disulfide isomerase/thioredoxin